MMESDDPGPVVVNGELVNQGVYHEPSGAPAKDPAFDVTATHTTDGVANLTNLTVRGSFYNGMRTGRNMVLNLNGSAVTGVMSSTSTRHAVDTISAAEYRQISEVTNTVGPTVNNGVIVSLQGGSTWTVTGTSYLSRLTLADTSAVRPADGKVLSMTVGGVPVPIVPGGTYQGAIQVMAS